MPIKRTIRFKLDPAAQDELKRLIQLPSIPAVVYRRARAILLRSTGLLCREVSKVADLDRANLFRWTKRYREQGIAGIQILRCPRANVAKSDATPIGMPGTAKEVKDFAKMLRQIKLRSEPCENEECLAQQQSFSNQQ